MYSAGKTKCYPQITLGEFTFTDRLSGQSFGGNNREIAGRALI